MAPIFANQSCDAFQPRSRACELGNYVRYAVNATSVADIQATIAFAQEKNVRFVIRNTGHDYLGRSTGAGALAVWTHYMKGMEFLSDFDDGAGYRSKAVKLGAGVQGFEIMEAARDQGVVVVGGECPTVGIAGGYTQGGGHSALSTSFGLSADNVLSWELVTADGALLTASKTENPDLYWALSGGGGGTFGVVVSMTVKTYPDAVVSGAKLSFYAADNHNSSETLYAGIQAFHEALPAMVDAGSMVIYFFNSEYFSITPLTIYNKTQEELQEIMQPFESALKSLSVNYTVTYSVSISSFSLYTGRGSFRVFLGDSDCLSSSIYEENLANKLSILFHISNRRPTTPITINTSAPCLWATSRSASPSTAVGWSLAPSPPRFPTRGASLSSRASSGSASPWTSRPSAAAAVSRLTRSTRLGATLSSARR